MAKRYSGAYIIAFHFCSDVRDVSSQRYQSTRYPSPALYTIGDDYYCAPAVGQKPTKGFPWEKIGEHYGRSVYRAKLSDMGE